MNFKKTLIVYRKEILELLRDKRTLFATIVLPVILYPLLMVGFSTVMSRQTEVLSERGATVAFYDSLSIRNESSLEISSKIQKAIGGIEHFSLLPAPPETETLYEEKEIQAIVTLSDSLSGNGLEKYRIGVRYDASGERGQLIFSKIDKALISTHQEVITERLLQKDIDPELIEPFIIDPVDTSTTQKKMGSILGMILPYMMILMLVVGASTVAADLVAGEKERHTLETLLVSSATRTELVMGKYLTIITMAMVNVIINLISISISIRFLVSQIGMDTAGLQMPVSAFLILLVAMLPLATLYAALLLSISTFSRNMKEARTYEQPIIMVSIILGMLSFIPSIEISNLLALIPVVNISLLFKAVMINEYQLSHLLLTIGSTLILDVLAILLTVKLFKTESVLFRTDEEGSIKTMRKTRRGLFNSFNGLLYYSLALVALYYIGGKLQSADLVRGLVQTQLFVILLPVLIVLRIFRQKPSEVLRLNAPRLREIALVPFIAVSAAVIVSLIAQLINWIFPFPQHYLEELSKVFMMDIPLWQMFLVIAILPGICEEILFRGFMIRFYERNGMKMAIFASAFLFAFFHLDPFRFLPVFLLGLLLGYLTLRSGSIFNSMLSHAINNALSLFIVTFAGQAWLRPLTSGGEALHWWVAIPAVAVFAVSIWAFHRVTADRQLQDPNELDREERQSQAS